MTTAQRDDGVPIEDPRATAKQVARDLCEVLGIRPQQVRSIVLEVVAGQPVAVRVERFLTRDESHAFKIKLEQYTLAKEVEIDDAE